MTIEIGKKYLVISDLPENNGLIVTVIGYLGTASELSFSASLGDRYEVDTNVMTNVGDIIRHLGEKQLRKIDDDDSRKVVSWEELEDIWTPEIIEEKDHA